MDQHPWNLPLFVAVAVAAVVTLHIYPTLQDEPPEQGEVLHVMRVSEFGPDDRASTTFWVNDTYERIALSYDLTLGIHPRATLTAPSGLRIPADYSRGEIDLEVLDPRTGLWTLTLFTAPGPGLGGAIEGDFIVLGFGGPRTPPLA